MPTQPSFAGTTPHIRARNAAILGGYLSADKFTYNLLDRNQRARLLFKLEAMERITRGAGRRNGAVGRVAIDVLRCLLLRFCDRTTARCFPSVAEVMQATRYSRAAIFKALGSLEAVGVLTRHQRLARVADSLGRVFTRQTSNLYTFHELAERTYLPLPAARPRPMWPKVGVYDKHRNAQAGLFEEERLQLSQPISRTESWRDAARRAIGRTT